MWDHRPMEVLCPPTLWDKVTRTLRRRRRQVRSVSEQQSQGLGLIEVEPKALLTAAGSPPLSYFLF